MPPSSSIRAREVCQRCHSRKVKCDVSVTGSPCSHCARNGAGDTCVRRGRKAYTPRKANKAQETRSVPVRANVSSTAAEDELLSAAESGMVIDDTAEGENQDSSVSDQEAGRQDVIADAISEALQDHHMQTEKTPLFVGDKQGIGVLLDAMNSNHEVASQSQPNRHLMISKTATAALLPEDLEYLKAKGCFSLPSLEICDMLIWKYFEFVHPMFPIIDAKEFTKRYNEHGVQQINLLLLWSMMSVSASYVSHEILKNAGFKKSKDWKQEMVRKAKLLFDISQENDKVILIQSALLLGFWFVDIPDVMQSWHWTGIAIGIAQTLGLHRNPDLSKKNKSISDAQKRLWRSLWWACVMRDTWLAFGVGRPMRVDLGDSDCPMPYAEDAHISLKGTTLARTKIYKLQEEPKLARLWPGLLQTTKLLRTILRMGNAKKSEQYSEVSTKNIEMELNSVGDLEPNSERSSKVLATARFHLQLHQQAALIALYRITTTGDTQSSLRRVSSEVNTTLQKAINDGLIEYSGPMTIPLVVPAMHQHLMAAKDKDTLRSQLGLHDLELCLMFLKAIEDNYPAASIMQKLFRAAIKHNSRPAQARSGNPPEASSSIAATTLQEQNGGASSFLDALPGWSDNTPNSENSSTEMFSFSPLEYNIWSAQMGGMEHDLSTSFEFSSMINFSDNTVPFFPR